MKTPMYQTVMSMVYYAHSGFTMFHYIDLFLYCVKKNGNHIDT
ncbi:MAG: hypothetical protein RL264_762 [Bacteroidota bacterium]|jgi:hypothetical protein